MGQEPVNVELPTWAADAQPRLRTARLALRPFARNDAPELRRLAGQRSVADTMISVPHPYPEGQAEKVIAAAAEDFRYGLGVHFAITLKEGGALIGAIELREIEAEHAQAETSFWIGPSWQGRGHASEALEAVVAHGFEQLGLNRIYAHHMTRNPASGRVLEKAGFTREGLLRQRVCKWGVFEDVVLWAILLEDWLKRRRPARPTRKKAAPPETSTQ